MTQSNRYDTVRHMQDNALSRWLIRQGMSGRRQKDILQGYSERLVEMGVPVARILAAQNALHPEFGGVGFLWNRDREIEREVYEHREHPQNRWLISPMRQILETGAEEMRVKLAETNASHDFAMLDELREAGMTDYFAAGVLLQDLADDEWIDPDRKVEGVLISFSCDGAGGFSDEDIAMLRGTLAPLGLALKASATRQTAEDLLGIYLGRDAGRRVLSGELRRGSLQEIDAVIASFDLTGFTAMSQQVSPGEVIEMLNAYFGVAAACVEAAGGHVLKFMGDGFLALFDIGNVTEDSLAALGFAAELRRAMAALTAGRQAAGVPATGYTLALHAGQMLYGNIGADNRLDFTAIGPAVNMTARLGEMHRALGRSEIVSADVVCAAGDCDHDLVSLGRYMLRGVETPQELYTIYVA